MNKSMRLFRLGRRIAGKINRDRIRAYAAESAFFTIMSFFPMLMLLLLLVQYTPLDQKQVLDTLEEITPFRMMELMEPIVKSVYNSSFLLVPWTVFAAIWTAGKGIMGISDGLNSIYRINETKNYIVVRIRAACYTLVMLVAVILSLGILVFGYGIWEQLRKTVAWIGDFPQSVMVLLLLCAMLLLIILFLLMYMFLPDKRMNVWDQLPGAVFSAVSWAVFSYGFSIYLEYSVKMSMIYGGLATLVIAMLWLYCCMYLLFIGAEINHCIEHPELL